MGFLDAGVAIILPMAVKRLVGVRLDSYKVTFVVSHISSASTDKNICSNGVM